MLSQTAERHSISLRAFAEPAITPKSALFTSSAQIASDWTLIFDTETTTDAGQTLRFGAYQLREKGELRERGVFYGPELKPDESTLLKAYALEHAYKCMTAEDFIETVFFDQGYGFRATIVGFNLPFDISRLAVGHAPARRNMFGGFSFKLSPHKLRPHVQVKHLSRPSALIRFAAPFRWRDSRSARNHGRRQPVRRGFFVDLNTFSTALFSRSFTLKTLAEFLGAATQKAEAEEHGGPLTTEYIDYAVDDVQATWECYDDVVKRYRALDLRDTEPPQIYSEASIGKAYLKALRVKPWREVQKCPASLAAITLSTYFGGRSEVRIRRELRQVVICDFLSMYPTVCVLMRLWQFVVAEGMTWRDGTEEVRALLRDISLADLQSQKTWRKLTALVRVHPDSDIFAVRADYDGVGQATIGANYLSADGSLWFTLADCVAAKVLSGKVPEILEALVFEPGPQQPGLQRITLLGDAARSVDPSKEDFYKRLIELRQEIKDERDAASGSENAGPPR